MHMSKISSKGQITVPKSVREVLQLSPGDWITFTEENNQIVMVKISLQFHAHHEHLKERSEKSYES